MGAWLLVTDAGPASGELHDIADLELATAAQIDVAVDGHVAGADRLLGFAARVDQACELEELAKADDAPARRDVVNRCRSSHACIVAGGSTASGSRAMLLHLTGARAALSFENDHVGKHPAPGEA